MARRERIAHPRPTAGLARSVPLGERVDARERGRAGPEGRGLVLGPVHHGLGRRGGPPERRRGLDRRGFVAVTGTGGTVGIDDGEAWIADAAGTRPLVGPDGTAAIGGGRVDDDLDALGSYEIRHYEKLAAAFLAAVEGRDLDSPVALPTFADGLGVMRCMDAMRASAATGGTLTSVEGE